MWNIYKVDLCVRGEKAVRKAYEEKRRFYSLAICIITMMLAGYMLTACSVLGGGSDENQVQVSTTHNPTGEEVLNLAPDSDIFMLEDLIYKNADSLDWVQQLMIEDQSKVGEITALYNDQDSFTNGMSTKLPVGTEIYRPTPRQGDFLIIELDGKQHRYLALIEG